MSLEKISKNKPLLSVILAVIIFIIVFSFHNIFYSIDKKIQNKILSYKTFSVSKDIIVLEIDENTLKKLGRFPFNRNIYTDLIENLENAGVSTIGFDIIFADKTNNDKNLEKTFKRYKNIILGSGILSNNEIEKPLNIFEKNIFGYGYFRPNIDIYTKNVYSFKPQDKLRTKLKNNYLDKIHNHFTVEILKNYYKNFYGKDLKTYSDENYFYIGDKIKSPFEKNNSKDLFINFISSKNFDSFSFIDVYNKKTFDIINKDNIFENKIVLIGATAKGLKDIFLTPNGQDYGIYVHANIINNFITNTHYIYFNKAYEWILIFLLIIVGTYFNLSKNSRILLVANIAVVVWFSIYFLFVSIFTKLILNNPSSLIFSLILSLTGVNFIKYWIEDKNKSKLAKALSEYISEDIAKKILSGEGDLKLEGEEKKLSIFFSDIAGFTTISEKFNATKLVKFLREYLSDMSNIIMDERGFINKYEGDAIMALFGTFGYEDTSTYDNCKSALEQQFRLSILNEAWKKEYGQILEVRMGLHTGSAIIGNIGAKGRKMEFTALGDSVNLASRLEGVNKFYGTFICVSETVYAEEKDNFDFRYLDKIRVKGKNNSIKIYELLGFNGKTSSLKLSIKKEFEEGLKLYFEKDFEKASDVFSKLSKIGDKPSSVFSRRCLQFEIKPPEKDWDGVWTMKDK